MTQLLDQYGKQYQHNRNPVKRRDAAPSGERWMMRRWESADTHRLNKAHWQNAHGQSINQDLNSHLSTLCARCTYEAANNPIIEGMMNTYATDVIGPNGPKLQVLSSDKDYNKSLEKGWRDFWALPDINRQLSGTELLRQKIPLMFTRGEFLDQLVTEDNPEGPVSLRVHALHPSRLQTPMTQISDNRVVMGIRLTKSGRPIQYYINEPDDSVFGFSKSEPEQIPADLMIHGYKINEPGQIRGVPWLASALNTIADLRDYDTQVLDAARQAASLAVLLFSRDTDNFMSVNESTDIERATISTCPPGWEPYTINPTQPTAQYVEYRSERMIDFGRPINMPLMMVRLSAQNHNYSSARFDGQIYYRGLMAFQRWLENLYLNRLLVEVQRELELSARFKSRLKMRNRPEDLRFRWIWTPPAHVDPKKEADAQDTKLRNMTQTLTGALAAEGIDIDDHLKILAQELNDIDEIDPSGRLMDFIRAWRNTPQVAATPKPEDDDDDDETNSANKRELQHA